jgi:serine/threonine protein kinase
MSVELGIRGVDQVEVVGRGSLGVVYRARDVDSDQLVAIRVLSGTFDEKACDLFERKIKKLASLASSTPNIAMVYRSGTTDDGHLYLLMEFAARGSLAERVAPGRVLGASEAADLGAQLGDALEQAHEAGIVHGDVKPENVLLLPGKRAIAGFGIAQLVGPSTTRTRVVTTSVAQAAPELLEGQDPTPASDQYSLASTIFTAVAGHPPFVRSGDEPMVQVIARTIHDPPPDLRPVGVPEVLCVILERGLAKDAAQRYSSIGEFARALRQAATPVPGAEGPTALYEAAGPPATDAWWAPDPVPTDAGPPPAVAPESSPTSLPASHRAAPPQRSGLPTSSGAPRGVVDEPGTPYDENVQYTVFRPTVIRPDTWYPLLAFAHLSTLIGDVVSDATLTLVEFGDDYRQLSVESKQRVAHGARITVVASVPGVEFEADRQTFRWLGRLHRVEFQLRAPNAADGQTLHGLVSYFADSVLVGDVSIAVTVDSGQPTTPHEIPAMDTASPYRKIFASYSRKDTRVVRQFERFASGGDRYLRDVLDLRAGERWTTGLEELIGESDVFQLFWSKKSMGSRFVEQEWRHALALRRPNFVRPVYWEQPFPSRWNGEPPPELRDVHFQEMELSRSGLRSWLAPQ